MPSSSDRFNAALKRFDEENGRDPNVISVDGIARPREVVYAEWLTGWVLRLSPAASEPLLLAARCQHLCRWMIPRSSYEMTRAGYLRWREDLKEFHARRAAEILQEVGYPEEVVAAVRELNLKANRAGDPECQTLEDALCLVTLEHQLDELIAKTEPEKMLGILRKTWGKMSASARQFALELPFTGSGKAVIIAAKLECH
jgi:hypothetical protein